MACGKMMSLDMKDLVMRFSDCSRRSSGRVKKRWFRDDVAWLVVLTSSCRRAGEMGGRLGRGRVRRIGPAWAGLRVAAAVVLVLGALGGPDAALARDGRMTVRLDAGIEPGRYALSISRLASPEMAGRRVGTEGGRAAIAFMEARFREAGLVPPRGARRLPPALSPSLARTGRGRQRDRRAAGPASPARQRGGRDQRAPRPSRSQSR